MKDLKLRMREILEAEAQAIKNIPVDDGYARAVEIITERVNRLGGKLVTSGMGKAGQIAMNIATTFCSTGTPSVFLHPSEAQHGDLGIIQKNDVMLLLSNSGKTREIVELVELAKNLNPDVPMIVITGDPASPLAATADVALFTGGSPEVCPLGMTPTTSTTMMTTEAISATSRKRRRGTDPSLSHPNTNPSNDTGRHSIRPQEIRQEFKGT